MKKKLFPLLALLLTLLWTAANAVSVTDQVTIASIYDAYGKVSTLTDDSTATVWTKSTSYGADLTLSLYGSTVGEIWIRSGHCYSQNYYNHYDRPEVVQVTVWYQANQYTVSTDTYRYRLIDAYRPNTFSANWNGGYQRLLLPKAYTGVTRIELTIESSIQGTGRTGAAITDILLARGSHATATPKSYATSTPRPYTVYVTPSPEPYNPDDYVEYITPRPTEPLVEYITPKPTQTSNVWPITPKPAVTTPLVELITPEPVYPSEYGIIAQLNQRIATRTGPSNDYDEPGSFFSKGDYVRVLGKAWDTENAMWWYQVEFQYSGEWYRAYTPAKRIDLDPALVEMEPDENEGDPREVLYDTRAYYGPGTQYKMYKVSMVYEGSRAEIFCIEGDWAQIEYRDYALDGAPYRRGWIPLAALSDYPFEW